jgi:Xaa-Pro aminopeptidase
MGNMEGSDTPQRNKTPEQVAAIEEVQRAAEAALAMVLEYLHTSSAPTSEEAHAIIDAVLTTFNCESPERHIVAGGLQSAEPHEEGSGLLKRGGAIVIDIYPRSKTTKYFADMSRTVCLGKPSVELQKMYDAVLGAQELAIAMLKPGVACKEIQKAVEDFFISKGYATSGTGKEFKFAEGFVHGVGHGVGLNLHEAPHIRNSDDILMEGDVVTVEPGLYYKHIGGVRIEDMLLVTKEGSRNLTRASKQFVL